MPVLANLRHELFCLNLCKGMKSQDAYEGAGYTWDERNCTTLRKKPHIQARIQEIMTNAASKVEVTASRAIQEMAKIAFGNITDYHIINDDGSATVDLSTLNKDQAAAITEIVTETDEKGNVRTKIKLADKKAALDSLFKHFGLFTERVEHGLPGDFSKAQNLDDLEAMVAEQLGPEDAQKLMSMIRPEKMN